MARNTYSLQPIYESFNLIPQTILDDIWHEIKDNTTLPDEAKTVVLKDLNSKWKQGKYELKRDYYKPHVSDKAKLAEVPTNKIPLEQWSALVGYWELPKTQEEAARNAQNISRHEFHHQLGRTPMFEVAKELVAENIEPSRIELFARSRARKDKLPVNENTSNIIHQLKHAVSQVPIEEQTSDIKEKIWTDFMGFDGHGRVRCMGQGITPSKYRNSFTSNDTLKKKIREEVIEEVRGGMKEQIREEMREQLGEEMRDQVREEMRERLGGEMREQIREEMREQIGEEMRERIKAEMKQQFAQEIDQIRGNITQEVAENVMEYFGLGCFPVTPFLSNPVRTHGNRQVGGNFMAQVGGNFMARGGNPSDSTTNLHQF